MQFHTNVILTILSTACIALTPLPAQADDMPAGMAHCMQAPALNDADANKLIDIMRDNLKKMDAQLDKIRNAKDNAARDIALQEYALTQSENMRLSHGIDSHPTMPCGGMMEHDGGMGHCMMGHGMMGEGMMGEGMAGDAEARIRHLEQRMNNMQKMLDQMQKAKPASQKDKRSN